MKISQEEYVERTATGEAKMEKTFNLKQHMEKQANMAYEGGRGYFLAQTRAWMNCIKCNQEDKKSAQESWQSCFDEFQKGDGKLSWIQNHMGKAIAEKVKRVAGSDYKDQLKKLVAEGKPISVAVSEALGTIDSK